MTFPQLREATIRGTDCQIPNQQDSLDLCESASDSDGDDHIRLEDRQFYLGLFRRNLSPRALQALKRGVWDTLAHVQDAEGAAREEDVCSLGL